MSCQRWHRTWTREQQRCNLKLMHFSHAVKNSSCYSMSGILYPTSAFGILSHGADWKTLITILPENQSCAGTPKWNNPVKDNKSILFTWGCIWILTLRCTCAKEGGTNTHTAAVYAPSFISPLPHLRFQVIFRSTTRQASSPQPNLWTTKMWQAMSSGSRQTPWRSSCPTCACLQEVRTLHPISGRKSGLKWCFTLLQVLYL